MFLDLLFPKNCFECKKPGRYMCEVCLSKVEKTKPICPICKRYGFEGRTHSFCKNRYTLDGLISIYKYEGVIRKAILALKYRFIYDATREIVESLSWDTSFGEAVLIPIPLHKKRENWRGFNQAEMLAKLIRQKHKWEYKKDVLLRLENTIPQATLSKNERVQNIRGKFAVNKSFISESGKIYIIFDDVWTTGSTISEACKVLKKAGAKQVWGMSIART